MKPKNDSRFRFSHLILIIFLVSFAIFFGYLMLSAWAASHFKPLFLLYAPLFLMAVIFPLWCSVSLIQSDIKNMKEKKSTSLYEENGP